MYSESANFYNDISKAVQEDSLSGEKLSAWITAYEAVLEKKVKTKTASDFKSMLLKASKSFIWPFIEGVYGVFCAENNIEPDLIAQQKED